MSGASIPVVLFAAFLLASCAPRPAELVLDTGLTSASHLLAAVSAQHQRLISSSGRGTISFDGPDVSGTAAFESSLKTPDSLLVSLEGPFGIDVGTFFLSREKYVLYNSFENRVFTGVPTDAAIRSVVPFDLTYDQLLNTFSGLFNIDHKEEELVEYGVDNSMFMLAYDRRSGKCRYWVDPVYALVARVEVRDAEDRVVLEMRAGSFTSEGGASAPKRISMQLPLQNRQVFILYRSLSLNVSAPRFAFSIPASAETVVR